MDAHAQLEIRAYADLIGREIVARWVPLTWEAFLDYRLGAVSLSRLEGRDRRRPRPRRRRRRAGAGARGGLARDRRGRRLKRHRERAECEEKLAGLGISLPWDR